MRAGTRKTGGRNETRSSWTGVLTGDRERLLRRGRARPAGLPPSNCKGRLERRRTLDELAAWHVQSQQSTGFLIVQDRRVIYEHNWPLPPEAANCRELYHGTDTAARPGRRGIRAEEFHRDPEWRRHRQGAARYLEAGVGLYRNGMVESRGVEQETLITVRHLLEMNSGLTEQLAHEALRGNAILLTTRRPTRS